MKALVMRKFRIHTKTALVLLLMMAFAAGLTGVLFIILTKPRAPVRKIAEEHAAADARKVPEKQAAADARGVAEEQVFADGGVVAMEQAFADGEARGLPRAHFIMLPANITVTNRHVKLPVLVGGKEHPKRNQGAGHSRKAKTSLTRGTRSRPSGCPIDPVDVDLGAGDGGGW